MMRDDKGQVSIELILVVGAILTMVLVVIPMVLKNAEMNKGLTAARDGATKGAAMRGMGYSSDGGNPSGTVKLINMTPIFNSTVGGKERYLLRFYVDIPSNMDSTSVCGTIRRQALSHLSYSFYGAWSTSFSDVIGSYYIFQASCIDTS